MLRGIIAAVVGAAALTVPAGAIAAWEPGPARYDVGKKLDMKVILRDGTKLSADVRYPVDPKTGERAGGKFPVLINQTPYGKAALSGVGFIDRNGTGLAKPLTYLVERGYINILADVRGTGASGGVFNLLDPAQGKDGVDLVNWAVKLPHADRKVGLYGPSYMAINQYLTAAALPKRSPVKAMLPAVSPNDPYRELLTSGGILAAETALPLLGVFIALPLANPLLDDALTDPANAVGSLIEHIGGLPELANGVALNVISGGDRAYEGNYWYARSPGRLLKHVERANIATLSVGGWFDVFQRGSLMNFAGLQNLRAGRPPYGPMAPKQKVSSRFQALMGPFTHVTAGEGLDLDTIALRWFDTWLKGEKTGVRQDKTPLNLYDLGRERYYGAARYPLDQAKIKRMFLRDGPGAGAPSQNDGGLSAGGRPGAEGSDSISFLGVTSPCTLQTTQYALGVDALVLGTLGLRNPCMDDDRTLQVGPGALTYTTAPFKRDRTIAGPIGATIYASSTRPETLMVATIEDVYPNGRSHPFTSGGLLGSFRELDKRQTWSSGGRPTLPHHPFTRTSLKPVPTGGAVSRFDLEVFPTFGTIAKGHRLRLTLTTSDSPHLLPRPDQLTKLLGGTYKVQLGGPQASSVQIPLAPAGSFDGVCTICD